MGMAKMLTKINEIRDENPNLIYPGQKLSIPIK